MGRVGWSVLDGAGDGVGGLLGVEEWTGSGVGGFIWAGWGRWVGRVGWFGNVWGRRGVFVADSVALVIPPAHPHHCKVSAKITPETIRLCVRI